MMSRTSIVGNPGAQNTSYHQTLTVQELPSRKEVSLNFLVQFQILPRPPAQVEVGFPCFCHFFCVVFILHDISLTSVDMEYPID